MTGIGDKTVKGLAPQSWGSVLAWAVLVVIFVSAPIQSTRLLVSVVGGTGRWIAYTAFAPCGSEPPMQWMTPNGDDGEGTTSGTPAAFNLDPNSPESQGVVDQAVAQVEDLHRVAASSFEIDTSEHQRRPVRPGRRRHPGHNRRGAGGAAVILVVTSC